MCFMLSCNPWIEVRIMCKWLVWDPDRIAFTLPFLNHPIMWYGVLFTMGFLVGFYIFVTLCKRLMFYYPECIISNNVENRAKVFSERLSIYVVISTVIGARLGHLIFYEKWTDYLLHPLEIVKIWEGGLASHGAAIGILIGIAFFYYKNRRKLEIITLPRILDLLVIPALFAGTLIRMGNFINQEVLGIRTTLPWAITFMHPADGSEPAPRHPAQLYEALFYLGVFLLLLRLFPNMIRYPGRLSGIFFILTFTFRFCIEFIKEEQSFLFSHQLFTMGQLLSIPMILLGVGLCLTHTIKRRQGNRSI